MAVRLKIDIDGVSFPFTTEYSIDSGNTWIAKAADEEYIIVYDDIVDPEKKIMIRSDSQDATVLARENLNLDNISYSNITIKNGKLIESMEGLFSGSFLGDIRISGVPNLKNIKYIAKSSMLRDFHIEPLPKCEDAIEALAYSFGRDVGNITIGDDTGITIGTSARGILKDSVFDSVGSLTVKNAIDASYVASNSKINVMGHVDVRYAGPDTVALATFVANGNTFKGSGISAYSGLYYKTDFDVCPSARYIGHNSPSVITGPESSNFLTNFAYKDSSAPVPRETYFPSVDVVSLSSFTHSSINLGTNFFYRNKAPLKFGGFSYSSIGLKSAGAAFYYATYYALGLNHDNPLALFSLFKPLSNINYVEDQSYYYSTLGPALQQHEFNGKTFYSNPTWFPRHEVLYYGKPNPNSSASTIGFMAFNRRYARIESIGSDIVITKNIRIQPLDECSMDGDVLTIANSTYAIGNSQGSYCYNNPANDGCIFVSSDGVTTQAIAGVVLSEKTMLSADEKWLYSLSSESIDTAGSVGQNIVQKIFKYSVVDGSLQETITINNLADTYTRLFYKAYDDYDLKIIIDKYDDSTGAYAKLGTYVTSIDKDGNISDELVEISSTTMVDVITHHYGETFEFTGVHLSSGALTRMIGK